jgi:protein-tyrosine phosphatase
MIFETHKKILFLCTGNYYRSRFSEHLFNALAKEKRLDWRADSRGLATEYGSDNVGAISPYTIAGLKERGLSVSDEERFPLQAVSADFAAADKIIALDEFEHRPLMVERFSSWVDAVEYWDVHDWYKTPPLLALKQIEQHIHYIIRDFQNF